MVRSDHSGRSAKKSAISTTIAVILTAIIVGSGVAGASYVSLSNTADAKIADLSSGDEKLNSQLRSVQDENGKTKAQVSDLNKKISELNAVQDDNSKLKSQVSDLNKRVSEVNEKVVALQRSAMVSFEFIPTPANIGAAYLNGPAGTKVRFLKFTTVDGVNLNGALWEPQEKKPNVAILNIVGSGANYTGGSTANPGALWMLHTTWASKGYAVLAINLRGAAPDQNTDNLHDAPKDVGAGVGILKSLGYTSIVLSGGSISGIYATQYAAVARDPAVKALVLLAPTVNRPEQARDGARQYGFLELYDRMYRVAKEFVAQGKPTEKLPERISVNPWIVPPPAGGPPDQSAIHFLTYNSPEGGLTTKWIRQVAVPVLIVRDQSDGTIRGFATQWLLGNATAPGSLVPSAKYVELPNSDPPSRAGHFVSTKNRQLMVDTVLAWLQEMKLQ